MTEAAGPALAHVAVAVRDLEAAAAVFASLGLEAAPPETVEAEGVRLSFVRAGNSRIELLEPLREAGPLGRFMDTRGEGIHHLAFLVPHIERAMAHARAAGFRIIGEAPRNGAHGTRVAFIHPGSAGGLLVELVEPPHPDARSPRGVEG